MPGHTRLLGADSAEIGFASRQNAPARVQIWKAIRVSSQSQRRNPAGGAGHSRHGRVPRPAQPPTPPPNALFAEMLRAARELLAVRSPLDAELMVSELLGTWWGQRPSRPGQRGSADVEVLIGEGLVEYAAAEKSPAALALLSGIAGLGTPRQAARAEKAALSLMETGIPRPAWAEHVGAVAAGECYVNPDVFGDRDEAICLFSYAGTEPHALVMVVDYNAGGILRDAWVTSRVDTLLERSRAVGAGVSGGPDASPVPGTFGQVAPWRARRMLEAAISATDACPDPPVTDSFPSYHAFVRARIRTLPPGPARRQPAADQPRTAQPGGWEPVAIRRQPWSKDRRAMLVAEFLASDEAEDLSDRRAASRSADHIVDYGCERDFGRPLRMSPAKAETFLLDWLPRKVMLSAAEQHSVPHVLAAWVRWAGKRRGLGTDRITETLDAVFESMGMFAQVYRDPSSFGLDAGLVARLLPDSDLEALPRRAFAFPVLQGWYGDTDLAALDPSQPADRRLLLAAYHDDADGRGTARQHLDRHLALAERLWRGDPPELWEAAQRLLDRGEDRHAALHTLMYVLRDSDGDRACLVAALRELPHEIIPPPGPARGS